MIVRDRMRELALFEHCSQFPTRFEITADGFAVARRGAPAQPAKHKEEPLETRAVGGFVQGNSRFIRGE
jgi:hypothetical protein